MKRCYVLALLTFFMAGLLKPIRSAAQSDIRDDIVNAIAWSPDGNQIALGDFGGNIRIFDVATQKIVHELANGQYGVYSMEWSPDGTLFAALQDSIRIQLWDTTTYSPVRTLNQPWETPPSLSAMIWSQDSQKVLGGIADGGELVIWDAQTGQFLEQRRGGAPLGKIARNPDRTRLAAVGSFGFGIMDDPSFIMTPGASIPEPSGKGGDPVSIAWSPNGKQIATGSLNGMVRLWDAQRLTITLELPGSEAARQGYFEAAIRALTFSPDNADVSSISATGNLRTFGSFGSMSEIQLSGRVSSAAWDAYGVRLAYAEDDHNRDNGPDIDERIHIIIPTATIESLNTLIDHCVRDENARANLHGLLIDNGFTNFSMMDLTPDTSANPFTDAVNALADADIATGCRADLLALESRLRH